MVEPVTRRGKFIRKEDTTMAESKRRLSKSETQDLTMLRVLGCDNIVEDYFLREARENLVEQGFSPPDEIEDLSWPAELKAEYARLKRLEKMEAERTDRKDRLDEDGESIYDGGDIDLTGDPEQDAWMRGDWWTVPRTTVIRV